VLLCIDGRLANFLACAVPGSLLALGVGALVHQQRAPTILDQSPRPYRYQVADDLHQPLAAVVAAEHDTTTTTTTTTPFQQPAPPRPRSSRR
jgi:hypothetical protein